MCHRDLFISYADGFFDIHGGKYFSDMLLWIEDIWIAMFNLFPLRYCCCNKCPHHPLCRTKPLFVAE